MFTIAAATPPSCASFANATDDDGPMALDVRLSDLVLLFAEMERAEPPTPAPTNLPSWAVSLAVDPQP